MMMTDVEKEKQPLEQIISCAHGQSQMSPLGEWPRLHTGRRWRAPRGSAAALENRTLGTTAFQGRSAGCNGLNRVLSPTFTH